MQTTNPSKNDTAATLGTPNSNAGHFEKIAKLRGVEHGAVERHLAALRAVEVGRPVEFRTRADPDR